MGRLHNALLARGVKVITDHDADIHVSGHPARDELVRVYQWVRPKIALPVHGEVRHMIEHAALARACQVPETIVAPNGTLVRLAPGPAEIIDHVPSGRLARDGDGVVPIDGPSLRERRKLLWNGAAAASLVIDSRGRAVAAPQVSLRGIDDEDGELTDAIVAGLKEMLADLSAVRARRRQSDRGGRPPGRAARRARAPRQEAVDGRAHRPHLGARPVWRAS